MSKAAFIILASGESPESMGRAVNALMGALEYKESGAEARVIFDGAGTQAAAALMNSDHEYHNLFEKVRDQIVGACGYCADAYGVKDALQEKDLPLLDEFKGHPSFKNLVDAGYTILTF